ncbi:tetraacyldisaccharide 4'-kinase [Pusillimonas sp.]|uniref:tetraacyldisaccharide 4'-kinase n=1 Tax=Pusillimonas sp. TaxID=3040095 RepID=UPI0029A9A68E|nr:tetraacyldisaccharide 4'-kinase [Pusillimonas sp.]MDX3894000.1 tetraacyldisaccharide 4'-kinase [Pusillimonas sp.]
MKPTELLRARVHALWQKKGPVSTALLPFAWITGLVVRRRKRRALAQPAPLSALPTVVVGNLLVGGTGKTPVVIAIAHKLRALGRTPGIVSRGYGAKPGSDPRTGQGMLDAAEFGDEPALIARATGAPVAVHPQRKRAREALAQRFPDVDVVISDDGLQHLALSRDVEIVVQDARGVGNGRLLPAGPLREPAAKLAEVDFIVDNGAPFNEGPAAGHAADGVSFDNGRIDGGGQAVETSRPKRGRPERIAMRLRPTRAEHLASGTRLAWPDWVARHRNTPMAAVAAIGQPARFFDTLRAAGLRLEHTLALPDHDAYDQSPFTALNQDLIAITAKDAVKCGRFADPRVWVVHVEASFSDPSWLDRLAKLLSDAAAQRH